MNSGSNKSIEEIIFNLNQRAPLSSAEEWDNVGLLLGDPKVKTAGAIVSVDLTAEAIQRASDQGFRLIITHHPCIFPKSKGLSQLHPGNLSFEAIQKGIAVASYHTNFDQNAMEVVEKVSAGLQVVPMGRLIETLSSVNLSQGVIKGQGYGFWGEFTHSRAFSDLDNNVRNLFKINGYWITNPIPSHFTKVAFVAGKGASFVEAAILASCDLLITGEVGYHSALSGSRQGLTVMEVGHRESEKFFIEVMKDWLLELGIRVIEVQTPTQTICSGGMK